MFGWLVFQPGLEIWFRSDVHIIPYAFASCD